MAQQTSSKGQIKVAYVDTLDVTHRERYFEKIRIIDSVDPYELPNSAWSKSEEKFPSIMYPDIVNYLIFTKSFYTFEDVKAWKSLEAYNQLTAGWIGDVCVYLKTNYHVVRGKVLHSQRLREKPLNPWIIAEKDGNVITAHCDCMAGLGEACTHIATLLFAVDATVKIRDSKTVTQEPAYWMLPTPLKQIKYRPVGETDFTSAQKKKKDLDEAIITGTPVAPRIRQPKNVDNPSDMRFTRFMEGVSRSSSKPAILSIVAPFHENYVPTQAQMIFPKELPSLFEERLLSEPFNKVLDECKAVVIEVTDQQIEATELATRKQSKVKLWNRYRAGRITASRFHKSCHTDPNQPSASLIKDICHPEKTKFESVATRWGLDSEKKGKVQYVKLMKGQHKNFSIKDSGFVISKENPWIGASPDGIVSCECCGEGMLEIKCPYNVRNRNLQTVNDGECCLTTTLDGKLVLEDEHAYFYQVQCQMYVCNKPYADLYVWTLKSGFCQRIYRDEDFMRRNLALALQFYKVGVLPELLARYTSRPPLVTFTPSSDVKSPNRQPLCSLKQQLQNEDSMQNKKTDETVYCYCRKEEFGDMVACDNQNCHYEWFHYGCVGILSEPKGKWFCPDCRKEKRMERQKKRQK